MNKPILTFKFKLLLIKVPFLIAFFGFIIGLIITEGMDVFIKEPFVPIFFIVAFSLFSFILRSFTKYRIFVYDNKLIIKSKKEKEIFYKDINNIIFEKKWVRDSHDGDLDFHTYILLYDKNNHLLGRLEYQIFDDLKQRKQFFELMLQHNPHIQLDQICQTIKNGEYLPYEQVAIKIKKIALPSFSLLVLYLVIKMLVTF